MEPHRHLLLTAHAVPKLRSWPPFDLSHPLFWGHNTIAEKTQARAGDGMGGHRLARRQHRAAGFGCPAAGTGATGFTPSTPAPAARCAWAGRRPVPRSMFAAGEGRPGGGICWRLLCVPTCHLHRASHSSICIHPAWALLLQPFVHKITPPPPNKNAGEPEAALDKAEASLDPDLLLDAGLALWESARRAVVRGLGGRGLLGTWRLLAFRKKEALARRRCCCAWACAPTCMPAHARGNRSAGEKMPRDLQVMAPTPRQIAAAGDKFWDVMAKHTRARAVLAQFFQLEVGDWCGAAAAQGGKGGRCRGHAALQCNATADQCAGTGGCLDARARAAHAPATLALRICRTPWLSQSFSSGAGRLRWPPSSTCCERFRQCKVTGGVWPSSHGLQISGACGQGPLPACGRPKEPGASDGLALACPACARKRLAARPTCAQNPNARSRQGWRDGAPSGVGARSGCLRQGQDQGGRQAACLCVWGGGC